MAKLKEPVVLTLQRIEATARGTFGVLTYMGDHLCYTLERPWADNTPKISCIPGGTYPATKHNGTRFTNVWELHNVPGREAILIHPGNTVADTEGCILVGMTRREDGIGDSQKALQFLRETLPDSFTITVAE